MSTRPEVLFPLFASIDALAGIGPKTARALGALGVDAPIDLLLTLPVSVVDRRPVASVQGAATGTVVTTQVDVRAHMPPSSRGRPYRIEVEDSLTSFILVFFHARTDYLERILPVGAQRIVSGKIEYFDGGVQMPHPDHIVSPQEVTALPTLEPVYPLTAGITQKAMFKASTDAMARRPDVAEWIDGALVAKRVWPSWAEALRVAHRPTPEELGGAQSGARARLAYDELFAHQLTLALARARDRAQPGVASRARGVLAKKVLRALPYSPTGAQSRAIAEIGADLARPVRMSRLLQGDVGAGKTLVAFLSMVTVVEAGGQAVMMAPTEILARQHLAGLRPLAEAAGVVLEILTGRDKGAERRAKLAALAAGDIHILVGTHAVFQPDVIFSDLRLAIVDEQHRFGVAQRQMLGAKNRAVDMLVMTATPIPRSLSLAQYGHMDVSILDEKPPGRTPVRTALVAQARLEETIGHLRAAIAEGRQAYWVCPLVEDSETVDLTSAEARFAALRAALGDDKVGLVHGQMPPAQKDATMAAFASGALQVLVATTVIEVGVDVPNASIMVIERAETFGMAQLHQLRGRVGRGAAASTCVLMYKAPLSQTAELRLRTLRDSEDGFFIAEQDLQMRGAGDAIGTAQSGLPRFRIADLERQGDLMQIAQQDARKLLLEDPNLSGPRGQAARMLLWLLRQDRAIQLISVG
jgi:ATP-dependent DNA helicase RecG